MGSFATIVWRSRLPAGGLNGLATVGVAAAVATAAALGGCGLPGGQSGISSSTVGDGGSTGDNTRQYAFARGRVPIVIVGQVTPRRDAYALKVTMTVGEPKYAVDSAVRVRVVSAAGDRFKARIDQRYLLERVSVDASAGDPSTTSAIPARGPSIDFPALLAKSVPGGPSTTIMERTARSRLQPFRIDTEVDPAVPEEVKSLSRELAQSARDWGLAVAFDAESVVVEVAGRRLTLAAGRPARCMQPICFRLPVPYHLRLSPTQQGWHGAAHAYVWLPNDGPVGALDVRNPVFVSAGIGATFENGMLKSLKGGRASEAEALLIIPAVPEAVASR